MPRPIEGCLPYIQIGDVIPPSFHHEFQNFDSSSRWRLDPEVFEDALVKGIDKLAYERALQYLRPRTRDLEYAHVRLWMKQSGSHSPDGFSTQSHE